MSQAEMYQKNLEFFKIKYGGVARQIVEDFPSDDIRILPAQTEGYFFLESKSVEGYCLPLHSRVDPRREARLWAANQDLAGKKHVLIFGMGMGYQVEALLELYPDLLFYVYEPDLNLFFATLRWRDWTVFPWHRVKHLLLDEKGRNCISFIRSIFALIKEDWIFLSIPSFERCYAKDFSYFKEKLLIEKETYVRFLVVNSQLEKEWTINAVRNVPFELQCRSIFSYRELFDGQSVVIAASGPSLQEAIPFLHMIKQNRKAIILAIGSAINVLLKNDLVPDLHISFDPTMASFVELENSLEKKVPLIFGSTIQNEIVKCHKGPKAYYVVNQDTILPQLYGNVPKEQIISDAHSVAVPALQLMDKLKVKRVIFAGQDLAYYQDYNYADGASAFRPDGKTSEKEREAYVEIIANDGEIVFSNEIYNVVRQDLEEILSSGQFAEVFNPSRHGARIKGAQLISWEDLIEKLPDGKYSQDISFVMIESGRSIRQMRKNLLAILEGLEEALNRLFRQIEKMLMMQDSADHGNLQKYFDALLKSLSQFSGSMEYKAFIFPMIRNEDHIIKKVIPDIAQMTVPEKYETINNQIKKYLSGARLSLIKLRQAVYEWN